MQGFEVLFEQVEFLVIAGIVLILAYLALEGKDIVYAVFFFGMMAAAVAGFFLLLEAPFIAGMQIAIYTGGISALIIFGVLLLPRAQDSSLEEFPTPRARNIGLLLSGVVVALSASLALVFPWYESFDPGVVEVAQSLEQLAEWLWSGHGVYVQIIALTILATLVGAVEIMKMEKAERIAPMEAEFGIEAEPEPDRGIEEETESPQNTEEAEMK
ncbi:MAG: NADH-quinone oxidoreductase subunit J [Candidatus Thorarchaeota archaeon]|nr:NADH-quinone oxidoreductase subunit J [Candidatus Thorarchaeota archaeon]